MVLRQILLYGPAYVMPEPNMMIPTSYERFDENGNLTDEGTRQRLRRFIEALYEWTERLARAGLIEKESVR
jgi:chromate reductase, NAD(P)H dehydrogenase (quinone)